jgi:hypothetical protein
VILHLFSAGGSSDRDIVASRKTEYRNKKMPKTGQKHLIPRRKVRSVAVKKYAMETKT